MIRSVMLDTVVDVVSGKTEHLAILCTPYGKYTVYDEERDTVSRWKDAVEAYA
jgi:hypothetical protein